MRHHEQSDCVNRTNPVPDSLVAVLDAWDSPTSRAFPDLRSWKRGGFWVSGNPDTTDTADVRLWAVE